MVVVLAAWGAVVVTTAGCGDEGQPSARAPTSSTVQEETPMSLELGELIGADVDTASRKIREAGLEPHIVPAGPIMPPLRKPGTVMLRTRDGLVVDAWIG